MYNYLYLWWYHSSHYSVLSRTVPVLTVSDDDIEVEEGESFSITCTSTDPTQTLFWDYPEVFDFSSENIVINGAVITVRNAGLENAGRYTCRVLGPERAIPATANVNVIPREDS